ncbi:hypothetical protein [uncultured Tenacibaculum sp.]|uniref:hypothetical protein n=1 Tax=uncultured Tenacibaculum sp. TaxID=174713 RepID=UPI002619AFB4|nr:hypothetical protein [uncultured Tenacibaculum sp.]
MQLFKNKKFKVRQEAKKFTYLPIRYHGNFFWLTRVKIEKSFNGMSMKIINIQKL